ncbi:MAG: hypothetical protein QGI86_16590 [Candidatus Poribacteria bacterium]|jgi:hypothetical protein|nr:hypothetical protein [Candidatus Poribacteria bacterium]MDP6747548.1 hypothetical protein [Candidatus Poribacteria bacterium]
MRFIHPILAFCLFCLLVTETVAVDSSAAVVESTFEQDLEGWTTYGDGFLLRRYPTGGNPGGYMWAHDMAWGPTNPKWAPKKFLDNIRYGQILMYDMKKELDVTHPNSYDHDEIVLRSKGMTIVFQVRPPTPEWKTYSVLLAKEASSYAEQFGWTSEKLGRNMWRIAAPRVKDTVIKKNGTVVEGYILKVTHGSVERFGLLYPPSDLPPSYIVEANDGRYITIEAKEVASYKSGGRFSTPDRKKIIGAWDEWTGVPRYGRPATEEEIRHVIENLTEFRIRGEYIVGFQQYSCSLDNVRLLKASTVVSVESRGRYCGLN